MRPRLALLALAIVSITACDFTFQGDDADSTDEASETSGVPETVTTEPPTPFCAAVDELERRIDESSTDDDRPAIVEAYTQMLGLVPADVGDDFEAVLAALREGGDDTVPTTAPIATVDLDAPTGTDSAPATTVAPDSTTAGTQVFEEGYDPEATPAGRISAYIDFACDRSENNPGPAATQPEEPPPSSTIDPGSG